MFLLFLPQPAVRLEAATQILRRLDSIFNLFTTSVSITQTPTISAATDTAITTAASPTLIVDDVIELTSLQEVESTLCDLLLFPEARPVLDINFDEIYRLQSASPTISLPQPFQMSYNNSTAGRGSVFESESKTLAEAFTNVLNLTSSEIAEVGVRCTAGDQVLAVLLCASVFLLPVHFYQNAWEPSILTSNHLFFLFLFLISSLCILFLYVRIFYIFSLIFRLL